MSLKLCFCFGIFLLQYFVNVSTFGLKIEITAADITHIYNKLNEVNGDSDEELEMKLMTEMKNVETKLKSVITEIKYLEGEMLTTLKAWSDQIVLELRLKEFNNIKRSIDSYYDSLTRYVKDAKTYEESTLRNFADSIVAHNDNSVVYLTRKLVSYLLSKESFAVSDNILHKLHKNLQDDNGSTTCQMRQSPQQILFSFYIISMATQIKSYLLIKFAYNYKKIKEQRNFEQEIQDEEQHYRDRIHSLSNTFRKLLQNSSRTLWSCDPKLHVSGKTYEEFTRLMQGYVLNEQNLSQDGQCFGKCDQKYVKPNCRGHKWCESQLACHAAVNCQKIPSNSIAVALDTHPRRYQYIHLKNSNKYYGKNERQSRKKQGLDVFNSYIFWNCDYCLCLCDNPGAPYSDRFLNLRATFADIRNNRVITGLRFVKRKRVIHLQIQEGKLLPYGTVDNRTLKWVPVNDYQVTDRLIYKGQDYHSFGYDEKRLDLDDLEADSGHVITGLRFRRLDGHVKLEIFQTPFDFAEGILKRPREKSNFKRSPKKGAAVELANPDVPTRSPLPSKPNSRSGQYIEFTHTDIEKDAAQTAVPFFDIQKIESSVPSPLDGIGIFHKAQRGYGGFITPRIITCDISKHISSVFSTD